jgi:3-methyladenine DNA glycosylase AlkD
MTADAVLARLHELADPDIAAGARRYFKTGPGEYGAGDVFLGIKAAPLHRLAREYQRLPLDHAEALLHSPYHEARGLALLILGRAFARADEPMRRAIYELYLANTVRVNNWDLVDCSAPHIIGAYLAGRDRRPLVRLARSRSLWERRIAILATLHFIRQGDFSDTLKIAEMLLDDAEDLIHKAVGWMLREVGKRDQAVAEAFLLRHHRRMPRTMLRYAIERFPEELRQRYLKRAVS